MIERIDDLEGVAGDGDVTRRGEHGGEDGALRVGNLTVLGLDLDHEGAATVEDQQIGNTRDDPATDADTRHLAREVGMIDAPPDDPVTRDLPRWGDLDPQRVGDLFL